MGISGLAETVLLIDDDPTSRASPRVSGLVVPHPGAQDGRPAFRTRETPFDGIGSSSTR